MSALDTDKVWKTLKQDPRFTTGVPAESLEVFRQIVDALPTVLGAQLEAKVSLPTLAQAKLDIVEHMLATGFADKLVALMVAALPAEQREEASAEMSAFLKDIFTMQRMPLMEMIHNLPSFLAVNGLTERMMLCHPQKGLNDANVKAYDQGRLTIALLLETQPALLLVNEPE